MSEEPFLDSRDTRVPDRPLDDKPRIPFRPTLSWVFAGIGVVAVVVILGSVFGAFIGNRTQAVGPLPTPSANAAVGTQLAAGLPPTPTPAPSPPTGIPAGAAGPPTGGAPTPRPTVDPNLNNDLNEMRGKLLKTRQTANDADNSDAVPDYPTRRSQATYAPAATPIPEPTAEPGTADAIVVSGGIAHRGPAANDNTPITTPVIVPPRPTNGTPQSLTATINDDRLAFASRQGAGRSGVYATGHEVDPLSRTEIFAGTPIDAQLDDAISTAQPGKVYAHLTRPVVSSLAPHIEIFPKATRLIGRYNADVTAGDSRVEVVWDYLILPDGRTFDLGGMQSADVTGENGLRANVDDHRGRIFTATFLGAILAAGANLAQPQSSVLAIPGVRSVVGSAVGSAVASTANNVIQAQVQQAPTLTIPRGRQFIIRIAQTILADPWVREAQ